MIERSVRNRLFARRLLEVMSVPSLAVLAVACGGKVVVDKTITGEGGAGGAGGTSGTTSTSSTIITTITTTTSTTTSTSTICSIPLDSPVTSICLQQGGACPPIGTPGLSGALAATSGLCDAVENFGNCCDLPSITEVYCGPDTSGGACCYWVWFDDQLLCGVGRPFMVEGAARTAEVRARADWATPERPRVDALDLDPATRSALADVWSREASFEHASVASFARLALELLAVGAPADLIRDAQRAMGDEIRHAELCFAIASGYVGAPVGPGPVAIDGALARTSLASIAAAAVREGCIGETIAALTAQEARDLATDPAVRAALDVIADDEAEHAAMSWRLVAWAHRAGDAEVRAAIAEAFAANVALPQDELPAGVDAATYRAHGRCLPDEARAIAKSALQEVILPSAAALMASSAERSMPL